MNESNEPASDSLERTRPVASEDSTRSVPADDDAPPTEHLPALLAPDTRLGNAGRYRIRKLLGKGGFGDTYLADDTLLDNRPCVIKRIRLPARLDEQYAAVAARMQHEVSILTALNQPGERGVPDIYDYLPAEHCLVMKYIAGRTLEQVRHDMPSLSLEHALRLLREIAATLHYLHDRTPPAVHCDVKPGNVLLGTDERVWLVDYGLARNLLVTEAHEKAGTPGYAPPEQWRGQAEPRSDVYALAQTALFLLAGAPRQVFSAGATPILPTGTLKPAEQVVQAQLERLLERALAVEVHARPTARAFLDSLDAMLCQLALPSPPAPQHPPAVLQFVGRAEHLTACQHQLRHTHLVLLVGVAGVGKTALAAQIVRQQRQVRLEAAFWHRCTAYAGVAGFLMQLAAFLMPHGASESWRLWHSLDPASKAEERPERFHLLIETLLHDIATRGPFLLCLDDLHALGDDPLAEEVGRRLYQAASEGALFLLLTSRSMPGFVPGIVPELGGLSSAEAATLLAQQAHGLDPALYPQVHALTDGNPQLLLLAAAALQHSSPADQARLLAHLAQSDSIADYLLREIDQHLAPGEHRLLCTIAALLGQPASQPMLRALWQPAHPNLTRTLTALRTRYLLLPSDTPDGPAYQLHSLVQAFYYRVLQDDQEALHALHTRIGTYQRDQVHDLLSAAQHFLLAADYHQAAQLVAACVELAVTQGRHPLVRHILDHLPVATLDTEQQVGVLLARGEVAAYLRDSVQAEHCYTQVLARTADPAPDAAQQAARAWAYRGLGSLLAYAEPQRALAWLRQGVAELEATDPVAAAVLRSGQGYILVAQGDYAQGRALLAACLQAMPPDANRRYADVLLNLGAAASYQQDYEQSQAYMQQALDIYARQGDYRGQAASAHNLGINAEEAGFWAAAQEYYIQARDLARQANHVVTLAEVELSLGIHATHRGDYDAAHAHLNHAHELAQQHTLPTVQVYTLPSLADLHLRLGEWDAARRTLAAAEALADEQDNPSQLAEVCRGWSLYYLAQHEPSRALDYAAQAVAWAEPAHPADEAGDEFGKSLRVQGQAALAAGQPDALEYFARSASLLHEPYELACTQHVWGAALLHAGEHRQGKHLLATARATFARLGALHHVAEIDALPGHASWR